MRKEGLTLLLDTAPEHATSDELKLYQQHLALAASSSAPWQTKLAALNIARIHILLYHHDCEWVDLPSDAWIEYCEDDAIWLDVLLSGSRENRCNRAAKEAVDMAASAIVKETREEKEKKK